MREPKPATTTTAAAIFDLKAARPGGEITKIGIVVVHSEIGQIVMHSQRAPVNFLADIQ